MLKYNKIIVLGGGSAGWMTASTLINQFPNKDITVIESPTTPTVGVGESTLGSINEWLLLLGIKDEDFMPHTDASYKLSIRFENFYKKGDGGFHYPFGWPYERNLSEGKENWFYQDKPNKDYANFICSQMALVNNNTITKNELGQFHNFNFQFDSAYHFDASKFGTWLRENYCKPRGVKHIVEDITDIKTDDNGIVSLNGHKADLYFDCTGFKSVLMKKLNVKFHSYSDLLPNNKAWATRVPYKDKQKELASYTNCTALDNGWVWNIPCWERIGTGYVYSDKYISDEEALNEFKKHLDDKGSDYSNSEFKNISMRVGIQDKLFYKNVCAIGLSAGFIEPLESNGLLNVERFLQNLIALMSRDGEGLSQHEIDTFNLHCRKSFDAFTMFVVQHYALSHRDDTDYWKDISNKSFDTLAQEITFAPNILRSDAKTFFDHKDHFNSKNGMSYITVGMNYKPVCKLDKLIMALENDMSKIKQENDYRYSLVKEWDVVAKQQYSLTDYLTLNIHKEMK